MREDNQTRLPNHNSSYWWMMSWLLFTTVQVVLVIIQRVELANYSSLIASHMPNMAEPEKSDWVMVQFHWTVIGIPAVAQVFLSPAVFLTVSRTDLGSTWKWIACIAAVLLSLFAWYNSLVALACTIVTFD